MSAMFCPVRDVGMDTADQNDLHKLYTIVIYI